MLIFKYDSKYNCYEQSIGGENIPSRLPLAYLRNIAIEIYKIIYYGLSSESSYCRSKSVGHDDKQSLCTGADRYIGFFIDI